MIKPSPKLIISLILGRIFIWKKKCKKNPKRHSKFIARSLVTQIM